MKVTQEQLLTLAKTIGIQDVQLVENEAESEFDLDAALTSVDANRTTILRPQIEQEIKETVERGTAGRVAGTFESALKRSFGCPASIFTPGMKFNEMADAAVKWKTSQLQGTEQEIQSQLNEILAKHQQDMETTKQTYEGQLTEANQKYINRDIKEYIQGRLKDAPIAPTADKAMLSEDFKAHLQNKYHLNYDEATRAVALHMKENPAMPALNETKTAQIDILSEAEAYFKPRGLWVTNMSGVRPDTQMPATAQGYKSNNASNNNGQVSKGDKLKQQLDQKLATIPANG